MHHSQLFALRLWTEETEPEASALRFQVQHVLSGEVRYLRHWSEVEAFVMQIFHEAEIGVQSKKEP
ncbi:MAG: hypothetical protein MUC51_12865 [Anaerolineae bacterium]|nr:hypothetical protein [Anaerolineae bacterium]